MLEKPIGSDSERREIISTIGQWIDEDRVFRLDHYLGKAAVQNLIALRFGNTLLEAVWNRNTSNRCTSWWPKAKAWMAAMPITPAPARCATWCRATSCSCCAWWRWNRIAGSRSHPRREGQVLRALRPLDARHAARDSIRGRYTAINGQPAQAYQPPEGSDVKPSPVSPRISTTGAGAACRSTWSPASACPSAPPAWWSR